MYALDANSLIYSFKGMGRVSERLLATPPREVAVPAVALYELEVGIAKAVSPRKRRQQLDEFLTWAAILPFSRVEARKAAKIRAELERKGTPIGPLDTLIAGTAVAHGATLVTRNLEEFGRVAGLRLQNWY
jgi:tRNA(fMet)-specific endonuclease VapC